MFDEKKYRTIRLKMWNCRSPKVARKYLHQLVESRTKYPAADQRDRTTFFDLYDTVDDAIMAVIKERRNWPRVGVEWFRGGTVWSQLSYEPVLYGLIETIPEADNLKRYRWAYE